MRHALARFRRRRARTILGVQLDLRDRSGHCAERLCVALRRDSPSLRNLSLASVAIIFQSPLLATYYQARQECELSLSCPGSQAHPFVKNLRAGKVAAQSVK